MRWQLVCNLERNKTLLAMLTLVVLVGLAPATLAQGAGKASHVKANDIILIQPKSHIRNVGALREKVRVVRGQDVMGRSEFEISCSLGAAYAPAFGPAARLDRNGLVPSPRQSPKKTPVLPSNIDNYS